ncbi:PAQR family membrane homeostasis protein TrhA [Salicibibacter kimchii]|uniref:Hemolysin III family protein n=1 Tax=Salicibibacter kimchii TaxID=2099786 RepID=A0A345C291_9BACI|nr:hemolysin III family protein [Salicibibacter kimchii]AXF57322.1 hemolysin III family protein [Salicibibacter kimchii]
MLDHSHIFTKKEEIANAVTHGIGSLLSIAALVLLIVYATHIGTPLHIVSVSIFGATMLLLYVCSTLVHSLPKGKAKNLFEILDHSSIYLFIAGTYTPILLHALEGAISWALFGIIWGLAITGIVFKVFFVKSFRVLSTLLYIVMGWIIVIAWRPLAAVVPTEGLVLLIIGGVFYTTGAFLYLWARFPYHHAIWHLFVIAGSAAHFFAILFYVIPL